MAGDLDILVPDRDVRLKTGEVVEVRAFSLRDGMKANAFAWPLIIELEALFDGAQLDDVAAHLVDETMGRHAEIMVRLISIATGKPIEWLDALDDDDGQALQHILWAVNSDFFTRRLLQVRQARGFATAR